MVEKIQDEDLVKADLRRQQEMAVERAPLEGTFREIERLIDPGSAGGFSTRSSSGVDNFNYDATAMQGLGRFDAAFGYVTTPRRERWHGVTTVDTALAEHPAAKRWFEHATDRLFACRYAPHTGAGTSYSQDRRALGSYGTGGLWIDEWRGRGLFYKSIHLSELFIGTDFRGRVDRVHRKYELTAYQAKDEFGEEALPDRIREACRDPKKESEKFEFLHVVAPNERLEAEKLDWRGKPIASRYIAVDAKWIVRKGGYHSMPIAVSRNTTSPGDKYGRSPAIMVLGTVKGLQEIARTILRAGHKAVDPALAFYDDGDISKLVTKPGGLNPGLVGPEGQMLVQPIRTGGDLMVGRDIQNDERDVVRSAFLEEFFKILTDPADRMTATQVLEMVAKEGVLIQPFAEAYETEKLGVMVEREIDILMRSGQIDPMPPEMVEAGARPLVVMTNPLARMARAQEAAAFTRWVEVGVQAASAGRPDALDRVNFDRGMAGVGEVLGVRPSWIMTDDELADRRRAQAEKEQAAELAAVVPDAAGAALDLAKANQLAQGLAGGGGL